MEAAILKRIKANENGPLRAQRIDGKTMVSNRRITVSQLDIATHKCFEYVDTLSVNMGGEGKAFSPVYWRMSYPLMLLPDPELVSIAIQRKFYQTLTNRTYFSIVNLFSWFNRINVKDQHWNMIKSI